MTLRYLDLPELERLRGLDADPVERAAAFADACRINTLYMIARAGSGHIGTSFSCLDVLSWLQLEVLGERDRYFSSKGHDAPALYAVLLALGRLPFERLHALRRLGGLPGHPDVAVNPEVQVSTGSLGMGISKAKGFVRAARLAGRSERVFVLTGDGELQEGQFWESLQSAANHGLGEITAIVDHNKLQSDTFVSEVSDLGDLEAKLSAFGWEVTRCDGNDIGQVADALARLADVGADRPKILVADTLKGAGVSFMEPHELPVEPTSLYGFHSGAPSEDEYERGLEELEGRLTRRLRALGAASARLTAADVPAPKIAPKSPQRLVAAYGEALVEQAATEPRLVVLDADLVLDCGLVPFRERFPDRFFECGIAEQDMVSQAGAMARAGLLPVVHSFACFLSTRPNEQIYNNATERTKVIYVGSLAGLLPGGPGHSHQSVRDISALGAVPGMSIIEPYCEQEVALAVRWLVCRATGPVYLRLVSVPWELGFDPPAEIAFEPGRGTVLREGTDAVIVGAGPIMVSQAVAAAELLARSGVSAAVIALPWLRDVDGDWLAGIVPGGVPIVCLDNHYADGGLGDAVLSALAAEELDVVPRVLKLAVEEVPRCGTNDEVLCAHGLSVDAVAQRVTEAVGAAV
ncbi:MAG: transketolase C-terminal domain-containing protein [Solirubrobacteraceae bacterium]